MGRRGPLIRSMFLRRLALLGTGFALGVAVLAAQAVRLTVVEGTGYRAAAERRLVSERWTPTVRGRIVDRKGRPLAMDAPAFDVMVEYELITGEWAERRAASAARRAHRDEWDELDRAARERLIEERLGEFEREQEALWDGLAGALAVDRVELDDRRREIEDSVERMANAIWERRLTARRRELSRDRELEVEVSLEDVAQPIREQRMPHAVAVGIGDEVAFRVRRVAEGREGIALDRGGRRVYPFETVTVEVDRATLPPPLRAEGEHIESVTVSGVATHVVGWLREAYREDLEGRPRIDPSSGAVDRGHYRVGDLAGSTGVEASHERTLRGLRGLERVRRDTGEREVEPPVDGRDVRLTLDVMVQARIRAAMEPSVGLARVQPWHATRQGLPMMGEGARLNGAAVVLDIDTGELIAMVSTPGFTREDLAERPGWVWEDPIDAPWVNRAVAKPYAPGSPMKPLILAAAVTEGAHALSREIECTGHLLPNRPDRFRCWIYKQNGITHNDQLGHDLNADDAICVSCNIYFYTLGRDLGPDGMRDWLGRFGVGRELGLGIGAEYPGNAGSKQGGESLFLGDAILMGIGQGPVAWTPTHAADAYATIVRGGLRLLPRVVADEPPRVESLALDPDGVDAALRGLDRALNDEVGSAYQIYYPSGPERVIDVPGVASWGKTGTATASPIVGVGEDGEPTTLRSGDHSWMIALVGREGGMPRYAIAVVMEYGGSGGRVAGPIAAQAVWALVAEGYL
jgi:penicillin-binding protein 2